MSESVNNSGEERLLRNCGPSGLSKESERTSGSSGKFMEDSVLDTKYKFVFF